MRFAVGENRAGTYTWWLYSGSDLVAWAGESFASHYNAQRAATAFKNGASTARYDIYQDAAQEWRWRAWRSSDRVASSGEAFASKYNAERAAENVRVNAGGASGA
ncbi:hypothetical protein GCM10027568_10920 [Humibacter soli]